MSIADKVGCAAFASVSLPLFGVSSTVALTISGCAVIAAFIIESVERNK